MTRKITYLCCLICFSMSAQNIQFADANFKNALLSASPLNNIARDQNNTSISIDSNADGEIQTSEALLVYRLNLNEFPINNIEEITNFTNLTHLNLISLPLLSVDFSSLSNLSYLIVNDTSVESINVEGCGALNTIIITNNNFISNLDLSGLSNLQDVECELNSLNTINLSGCANLEQLELDNNELLLLDVSGLINLSTLRCSVNNLNNIIFSGNNNLLVFDCGSNNLTSLDITTLPNLTTLVVSNNQLTELDISQQNLSTLVAQDNLLTEINLSNQSNLESIDIMNNQLDSLDLLNCPNLLYLACAYNFITTLDLSNNSSLSVITANDNALTWVNIKNGHNTFLEDFMIDSSFANNPDLAFVCVDEEEITLVQQLLQLWDVEATVNTYCSYTPGSSYNTLTGLVSFDEGDDGCGAEDGYTTFTKINMGGNGIEGATFTNLTGNYNFFVQNAESYTIAPQFENDWFIATPPSATISVTAIDNTITTQNFCITSNGVHPDLEVVIAPIGSAQPGFDAQYKIIYKNKGNQTLSGTVTLNYNDSVLDFLTAMPVQASATTGQLSWDYSSLLPFESRNITLMVNVNSPQETPAVNINDVLVFNASITPDAGDETPADNTFVFNHIVTGSFDPNDITCLEGATVAPDKIGEYLHYNINFENTGTAPATFIVVEDVIDESQFDISSLQILDASHNMVTQLDGNKIICRFDDINLGPEGKGNIVFKIKTLNTLQVNDDVTQQANIFFDYNWPIETNEATTVFATLSNGNFIIDASVKVYPNPSAGIINITADSAITSLELYDVQGRLLQSVIVNEACVKLDITQRAAGMYFVKVKTEKGVKVEKILKN